MSASTIKKSHALSELISSVRRVTENTLKWKNVDIKQQSREKKQHRTKQDICAMCVRLPCKGYLCFMFHE